MSHLATTHRPQQGRPGNTTTLSLKHGGEAVKGEAVERAPRARP